MSVLPNEAECLAALNHGVAEHRGSSYQQNGTDPGK